MFELQIASSTANLIDKEIHFQLARRLLLAVLHRLSVLDLDVRPAAWVKVVEHLAQGWEGLVLWKSVRLETLHPPFPLRGVVAPQTLQLLQPEVLDGNLQHHLLVLLRLRHNADLELVVDAGHQVSRDLHIKLNHVSTWQESVQHFSWICDDVLLVMVTM